MHFAPHLLSTTVLLVAVSWQAHAVSSILPKVDFNGDGLADLYASNVVDGEQKAWITGHQASTELTFGKVSPTTQWRVIGIGDFDGNYIADLLWYNNGNGSVATWLMAPSGEATVVDVINVPPEWGWSPIAFDDFDGDYGADHLLFLNAITGELAGIQIESSGLSKIIMYGVIPWNQGWSLLGIDDCDGDGDEDFLFYNAATCALESWLLDGNGLSRAVPLGTVDQCLSLQPAAMADFNGDSRSDVLWIGSNGAVQVQFLSENGSLGSVSLPDLPPASGVGIFAVEDMNRDGSNDLLLRNYYSGTQEIWYMSRWGVWDTDYIDGVPPSSGWMPAALDDYNGDWVPDVLWYNSETASAIAQLLGGFPEAAWTLKPLTNIPKSALWVISTP